MVCSGPTWPSRPPHYRGAAASIARELARRHAAHPTPVLWHVRDEFGAHAGACYCPVSAAAFRAWLQQSYVAVVREDIGP